MQRTFQPQTSGKSRMRLTFACLLMALGGAARADIAFPTTHVGDYGSMGIKVSDFLSTAVMVFDSVKVTQGGSVFSVAKAPKAGSTFKYNEGVSATFNYRPKAAGKDTGTVEYRFHSPSKPSKILTRQVGINGLGMQLAPIETTTPSGPVWDPASSQTVTTFLSNDKIQLSAFVGTTLIGGEPVRWTVWVDDGSGLTNCLVMNGQKDTVLKGYAKIEFKLRDLKTQFLDAKKNALMFDTVRGSRFVPYRLVQGTLVSADGVDHSRWLLQPNPAMRVYAQIAFTSPHGVYTAGLKTVVQQDLDDVLRQEYVDWNDLKGMALSPAAPARANIEINTRYNDGNYPIRPTYRFSNGTDVLDWQMSTVQQFYADAIHVRNTGDLLRSASAYRNPKKNAWFALAYQGGKYTTNYHVYGVALDLVPNVGAAQQKAALVALYNVAKLLNNSQVLWANESIYDNKGNVVGTSVHVDYRAYLR